jgi:hypothetical protein
MALSI